MISVEYDVPCPWTKDLPHADAAVLRTSLSSAGSPAKCSLYVHKKMEGKHHYSIDAEGLVEMIYCHSSVSCS